MSASLRVLSWNVHGLRDDVTAMARIVRDVDPDVMCVQEAPKYLRWRAKSAGMARRFGLLYVTGGGTTGGSALLVNLRVDVREVTAVCLSRQYGWPARGVAAAVVHKGATALTVASIHLPLAQQERLAHARRAVRASRTPGKALLVAGDINERPGGPAWRALAADGLRDLGPHSGPTFPATAPRKRIDGVLASADVEVKGYDVLDVPGVERASDHRPVLVTVKQVG